MPAFTRAQSRAAAGSTAEPPPARQPLPGQVYVLAAWDTTKPGAGAWLQAWRADSPLQVALHAMKQLLDWRNPLVFSSLDIDEVVVNCRTALAAAQPESSKSILEQHAKRLLLVLRPRDECSSGGSEGCMFNLIEIEDLTASAE